MMMVMINDDDDDDDNDNNNDRILQNTNPLERYLHSHLVDIMHYIRIICMGLYACAFM